MKKILLFFVVGLIVLVVAVAVGLGIFIGPIVKAGVEAMGPKITQVPIKLEAVRVSLLSGSATVKGLLVGNPEGYKTSQAIKLGTASIKVDPLSVFSDKIVLHEIHVISPEITYDGGLKGNNLSKILDNVNALAKKDESAPTSESPKKDGGAQKPAPKIQVDDFLISGAKVHVNLTGISSKEMTVSLPDIHLTGLGKDSNGLTATELVRVVLSQINISTVKAVTQAVAGSGKMIEGLGKDIAQNPTEKIKSVTKSIGGLFGK